MFAKPFDTAAATLPEAATRLGRVDLDDTKAVLSRGGDAAQVWAAAQAAEQVIASIVQVWRQVALLAPGVALDPRFRLLILADINPADYLDEQLNVAGSSSLRPFELARRGHRLSLATLDHAGASASRACGPRSPDARRQRAGAFTEDYRRTRGIGVR